MKHMNNIRRLSLRLPESVFAELEKKSLQTGNGISSIIRQAINEFLYGKLGGAE